MTEIYCSKCRSKWTLDENDICKSSALPFKQCKKCREQCKKYREDNRDKINEKLKEYYQNNQEKKKEYYQNNQEKIKANKTEKIKCGKCGSEIARNNIARHQKTKKCQKTKK